MRAKRATLIFSLSAYLPSMSLSISATADGVSSPITVSISIDQTNSLILQTAEGFGSVLGKPNARVEVKATGKRKIKRKRERQRHRERERYGERHS